MMRRFTPLPEAAFTTGAAYDGSVSAGSVSSTDTVARFLTWLLLDVATDRKA